MALSASAHVDTFCRDHLPAESDWPQLLSVPGISYPQRLNCAEELIDITAERLGPGRPCLLAPDGTAWTYGDVVRMSNQVAQVLTEDHGIVAGNRVLLRGPNTPWLAVCWLAVIKVGAVAVSTMPLLRSRELEDVAAIAAVDFALCDSRYVDELNRVIATEFTVVEYGGGSALTRAIAGKSGLFDPVPTASDDVALLAFTSGTTGRPKATVHFHRDVLAIADTFSSAVLRPETDDVFTGTPPLAFTFGLGGLLVFPLRAGASTLLLEKATPEELADMIGTHNVTVCFTAPTAYRAMLVSGMLEQLSTLRRAVSAGEHLPAATWQAVHDATGIKLIDGIGATEMLHIFISAADDDIRPGATGRAVPGYVATILDEHGLPQQAGKPGRLAVKGPTGCRYLADPRQLTYVRDGWNVTGDTFIQDDDGYFWYQARNDDMIISSGYNIAGPEVEEVLLAHPDVQECAVVGLPDEARGQVVSAFVVLRDHIPGDADKRVELQDFVKQRIAPYKYPRRIEFRASLPKTPTGKLQRFVLRDEYSALENH